MARLFFLRHLSSEEQVATILKDELVWGAGHQHALREIPPHLTQARAGISRG